MFMKNVMSGRSGLMTTVLFCLLGQFAMAQTPQPYFPETPKSYPQYTNANGTLTIESSVNQVTKTQLLTDIQSLFAIRTSFAHPLHVKKFKGFDGVAYKRFFYKLVDHIAYDPDETSGAVAYVGMDLFRIFLTPYYVNSKIPLIGRLGLLLHEANHSDDDNNYWFHAICPTPFKNAQGQDVKSIFTGLPLAGEDACDDQVFGSYSTSVLFFNNVADFCENCSEKSKWDAQIFAEDQAERVIEETAVGQLKKDRLKKIKKNDPNRKPYDRRTSQHSSIASAT